MRSEKHFFSEFYYPDEIVTENEGNVEVHSISRALPIWSHIIKKLNNLVCSGFTVKFHNFGLKFWFMDLAQRLGP